MINNELISICIPVYNGELYIKDTLLSVLAQTYSNIEILISDNCSTDLTYSILTDLQLIDKRIILYKQNKNIGYANNILFLVTQAKGYYVAIYHADDIYDKNIIQKQYLMSKKYCLDLCFVKMIKMYENNKIYDDYSFLDSKRKEYNDCIVCNCEDYINTILIYGNYFACPSLFIKRELFLTEGGYPAIPSLVEDLHLWIKLLLKNAIIGIVDEYLLCYRISQNQGSTLFSKLQTKSPFYIIVEKYLQSNINNLPLKKKKIYYEIEFYSIINGLCNSLKNNNENISNLKNELKLKLKYYSLKKKLFILMIPFLSKKQLIRILERTRKI